MGAWTRLTDFRRGRGGEDWRRLAEVHVYMHIFTDHEHRQQHGEDQGCRNWVEGAMGGNGGHL